jgi:hypothetical protein
MDGTKLNVLTISVNKYVLTVIVNSLDLFYISRKNKNIVNPRYKANVLKYKFPF